MNEPVEDYILNNFDLLPVEVLVTLLESLSDESRANLCRTDRRFSDICRDFNMTTADKLVLEVNPLGQLVPTRGDQADLIRRGFETVYSCVFNEIDHDVGGGDNYRSWNIPEIEELELLEMKFGLNNGSLFTENHGYTSKDFFVNVSIPGLPPPKGTIMHLLVNHTGDNDNYQVIFANLFDTLDDLMSSTLIDVNLPQEELDDLFENGITSEFRTFKRFEVVMP